MKPDQLNYLTDHDLLTSLMGAHDRLNDREVTAFSDMQQQITRRRLTRSQRQWAEGVYDKLELEADRTLNLVSTGQVAVERVPRFMWELNRPLRPPGR
jgi:hypothetical protein